MKIVNKSTSILFSLLLSISCGTQNDSELSIIGGNVASNQNDVKGIYPSTIGFITEGGTSKCTGTRVDRNLYISASHCFKDSLSGKKLMVFASNAQNFEVGIVDLRLASGSTELSLKTSDVASFGLQFISTEQKFVFDNLVEIARINYSAPKIDQEVTLAGFGCTKNISLSGFLDECLESPEFKYMKYAKSRITSLDSGIIFAGGNLYFKMPLPLFFDDKVNGYIGKGDSGGPVYDSAGELIGVNSALVGLSALEVSKGASFHAWLGHELNRNFIENGRNSATSFYLSLRQSYTFKNSDRYLGEFSQGFPHGKGLMHYSNGRTYDGSWFAGLRTGFGEQSWPQGGAMISYKGNWSDDQPHGQGTLVFSTGQIYEGEFFESKMHGHGEMTYADGDIREGVFVHNKREGVFTLKKPDGRVSKQIFKNDVLVKN